MPRGKNLMQVFVYYYGLDLVGKYFYLYFWIVLDVIDISLWGYCYCILRPLENPKLSIIKDVWPIKWLILSKPNMTIYLTVINIIDIIKVMVLIKVWGWNNNLNYLANKEVF